MPLAFLHIVRPAEDTFVICHIAWVLCFVGAGVGFCPDSIRARPDSVWTRLDSVCVHKDTHPDFAVNIHRLVGGALAAFNQSVSVPGVCRR